MLNNIEGASANKRNKWEYSGQRVRPFISVSAYGLPILNYRKAELGDISQLLDLEQRVIKTERPFNRSIKDDQTLYYDVKDLITSSHSYLLVAEDKNSIIGTGYAQIRQSKSYLKHDIHSYLGFMYVSPDYRGQGINKNIIDKLIIWSKSKGAKDFYLDVYSQNISAIKAYEKVGFKPCLVEMKLSLPEEYK